MVTIKNYSKIVPDAYHGTTSAIAKKICEDNEFVASRGDHQFLGDGVYFFEGSKWHAEDWAKRRKYNPLAVIRAQINLGTCLDISANQEHREYISHTIKRLSQLGKNVNDAVAINYFAKNILYIDTVRACNITPKHGKMFIGSKFYSYSQLIICVRNTNNITESTVVLESLL